MNAKALRGPVTAPFGIGARVVTVLALLLLGSVVRAEPDLASTAELERLMAQGVPVVDIRTRTEWEETGIIEGAHQLTFFDEEGRYNWNVWIERLGEIAQADQPLVLMCHSGVRSAAIARAVAHEAGYTQIYDYGPGIEGWLKEKRRTVPPTPSEPSG